MDGASCDGAACAFDELLPDWDGIRIGAIALALQDGEQEEMFEFAHGGCGGSHSRHCRQNTGPAADSFLGPEDGLLAGGAGCSPFGLLAAARLLAGGAGCSPFGLLAAARLLAGGAGCAPVGLLAAARLLAGGAGCAPVGLLAAARLLARFTCSGFPFAGAKRQ
jgi:hypothetical protein